MLLQCHTARSCPSNVSEVIAPDDRVLDWVSGHDPRSKNYTFFETMQTQTLKPIQPKFWTPGIVLDQGREGACVAYGWTGELLAAPYRYTEKVLGEATKFAQSLYQKCRAHDRALGWNWPEGASVLGGARTVRDMGYMGEFRWCMSMEELIAAVINEGPAVAGTKWLPSMGRPRPSGLIEIDDWDTRTNNGHCYDIIGYHPAMRIRGEAWNKRFHVAKIRNSWGPGYGINGCAYIKVEDLARLLKGQGEACVPMGRKPVTKL